LRILRGGFRVRVRVRVRIRVKVRVRVRVRVRVPHRARQDAATHGAAARGAGGPALA